MADRSALAGAVVDRHGETFAEQAGIRLDDKPGPLYQLYVLALLLSARISSGIAVAAATELFKDGLRSARAMAEASWQRPVPAFPVNNNGVAVVLPERSVCAMPLRRKPSSVTARGCCWTAGAVTCVACTTTPAGTWGACGPD